MRQIINISLPAMMVKIVKKEVKIGGFASTSEFFRHLIRLYNTKKLAIQLKEDQNNFKQGKVKAIEIESLSDLD